MATCGECVWHYDLSGANEEGGVANCLARAWPEVELILTTRDARCDLPERFCKRKEKDDAGI